MEINKTQRTTTIYSLYGTSAGTRLGPILFIMHLHDIPKFIKPKFADNLVAICVDNDFHSIQDSLQEATIVSLFSGQIMKE